MSSAADFSIVPLDATIFDVFSDYLRDPEAVHAERGDAANTRLLSPKAEPFRLAIELPLGAPGWRRVWVLRAADGRIVGHADLRAHPVPAAAHRCLIGVGVDIKHRRCGWGARLMAQAEQWLIDDSAIEWIDLQVLSSNEVALRLYAAGGYIKVGEIPEMFKLDGEYFSFISMSKKLPRAAPPVSVAEKIQASA